MGTDGGSLEGLQSLRSAYESGNVRHARVAKRGALHQNSMVKDWHRQ